MKTPPGPYKDQYKYTVLERCLLLIDKSTGFLVELEHLKIETTLIDDMLASVMGEYVFLKLHLLFIMNR